jgi:hypothetical protein
MKEPTLLQRIASEEALWTAWDEGVRSAGSARRGRRDGACL